MSETMKLRCASCGWTGEVNHSGGPGFVLAQHLRVCPGRDVALRVPRWALVDEQLECAWTTLDVNDPDWATDANGHAYQRAPRVTWRSFTEWAEKQIGIRT